MNTCFYRTPPVAIFETKHVHASTAALLRIKIGNLDWSESQEKETKHIHALAAYLLHIKIGNLDWPKCGHCKNADIASAKTPECQGSMLPFSFYGKLPDYWPQVLALST